MSVISLIAPDTPFQVQMGICFAGFFWLLGDVPSSMCAPRLMCFLCFPHEHSDCGCAKRGTLAVVTLVTVSVAEANVNAEIKMVQEVRVRAHNSSQCTFACGCTDHIK